MKINLRTSALAAILGLALAGVPVTVKAQTPTTPATPTTEAAPATPAPAKVKKPKPTPYSGTLTAIDTTGNTITVASTAKLLTLTIAPTTKIKKDKVVATLADFAIGDKVTGSYIKDATTGALTAYSLHKGAKAAKKASKPAAAAASAAPPATPAPAAPAAQ